MANHCAGPGRNGASSALIGSATSRTTLRAISAAPGSMASPAPVRRRQHAQMRGARWLVLTIAVGVLGCVPTPAGRATPLDGALPGGSDATTGESAPASSAPATTGASPVQPSFVRPTPNPSPSFLVHEVRAGESLTSIARLYGTTARSIAYWNRDRYASLDPDSADYEPNRIEVGWVLRVIPTEVVDEDELPDPTLPPMPATPASPLPSASSGPA